MKLLLAAALAIGLASVPLRQVVACSCAQFGVEEAARGADAVFAGTVVGEQPVGAGKGPMGAMAATVPVPGAVGQIAYTFAVDGVAKGDLPLEVVVLAGGDGASCGMSFGMGERWLVFASWDGSVYTTGLCSGNLPLGDGEEPPLPLVAPAGDREAAEAAEVPWSALGVLGVVVLGLLVSWVAFRREPST